MKNLTLNALIKDQGCLSEYDPNSLTVEQANKLLIQFLVPKKGNKKISIASALDHHLAEVITSPINVPNYDNSAMDGYVFKHSDLKSKNNKIKVIGKILAGHPSKQNIKKNQCLQIMTGGMIPKNFDAVIPQELVTKNNDEISFDFKPKKWANIRKIGEDIQKKQVALEKGIRLNSFHIGLLASLGIANVKVIKPIKIGFFSTGDEVIKVGRKIKPGQVYDSNRFLISSLIKKMSIPLIDYGNLSDNKKKLEKQLLLASSECDLVITTGGVSVGEADYMKEILSKIGKVLFWKMAIKPGRPMAFGKIKKSFYFGLPGNPVSAAVTFLQFVQPSIQFMMGKKEFNQIPLLKIKISKKIVRKKGRKEFLRGFIFKQNKKWFVKPLIQQGSGMLKSLSDGNCLIIIEPEHHVIEKGSFVDVQPFESIF
jgi:molybdopterin molybdotransferase